MLTLTLNKIMEYDPCGQGNEGRTGISKLMKFQGKTSYDDEEFDLMEVLKSNDIKDAIWCLRCFDYLDYCLFNADVTESVLHIYESKCDSKAPRKCIQAIRDFKSGIITRNELKAAADAANNAADDANDVYDAYASYAAYAATYAATVYDSDDATYDSDAYTDNAAAAYADAYAATYAATVYATYDSDDAATDTADAACAAAASTRKNKWNEIEKIFIKYFGDKS